MGAARWATIRHFEYSGPFAEPGDPRPFVSGPRCVRMRGFSSLNRAAWLPRSWRNTKFEPRKRFPLVVMYWPGQPRGQDPTGESSNKVKTIGVIVVQDDLADGKAIGPTPESVDQLGGVSASPAHHCQLQSHSWNVIITLDTLLITLS